MTTPAVHPRPSSAAPGRRSVLMGGAAACAGLGLAACGGDGSSDRPTDQGLGEREAVAPGGVLTAGLENGEAMAFETAAGDPGVLVRLEDGSYVAYSAVCTHQGCAVGAGGVELACPCHGSVFDAADGGQPLEGPASAPLPSIAITEGPDGVSLA